jgi:hypothetical protein
MFYSFVTSIACFHKDLAHPLVEICCLQIFLSILSMQRVVSVRFLAVDLVVVELGAKPAGMD